MKTWQETTLDELNSYFMAQEDVLALAVFGSLSSSDGDYDTWSDIDLLLVVKPEALGRYFPTTDWLDTFGRLYTFEQAGNEYRKITRAVYDDMRRLDFVITTETNLAEVKIWPRNPLQVGARMLFSRSALVDEMAPHFHQEPKAPKFPAARFEDLVRQFRFKTMLAIYKVAREDLLIALHLALDLQRDCAFLAMVLRDRAVGMDFHKTGGIGNCYVRDLKQVQRPYTAPGILEMIEETSHLFISLAREWDSTYADTHQTLLAWIEKARKDKGISC